MENIMRFKRTNIGQAWCVSTATVKRPVYSARVHLMRMPDLPSEEFS